MIQNKIKREDVDASLIVNLKVCIGLSRLACIYKREFVIKESPMSNRDIIKKTSRSLRTNNEIIYQELNLKTRKKVKVHTFGVENYRKANCQKFYEKRLAVDKSEFAVRHI